MTNQHKLGKSKNPRNGYPVALGAQWFIEPDGTETQIAVTANAKSIRITSTLAGDWETAEHNALYLDVEEAAQLAEILAAAVKTFNTDRGAWGTAAITADPTPHFRALQESRLAAQITIWEPEEIVTETDVADEQLAHLRAMLTGDPEKGVLPTGFNPATRDVILNTAGDKKIGVVKTLRQFHWDIQRVQLDLDTAMRIVNTPNSVVARDLELDSAAELARRLRSAGATVTVTPDADQDAIFRHDEEAERLGQHSGIKPLKRP